MTESVSYTPGSPRFQLPFFLTVLKIIVHPSDCLFLSSLFASHANKLKLTHFIRWLHVRLFDIHELFVVVFVVCVSLGHYCG